MNSCTTGVYLIMNIHGFQSLNIWKTIVGTEAGQPPHLPEDGVLDVSGVDVELLSPGGGPGGLILPQVVYEAHLGDGEPLAALLLLLLGVGNHALAPQLGLALNLACVDCVKIILFYSILSPTETSSI